MSSTISIKKYENTLFLLTGIVCIGLFLRLYNISFQSLWYDELHSIIPTDPKNSVASIVEYCKTDQPPFFFLYLHFIFKVFGYNEVVGRIACAFIGIVAIPVIYVLGKECVGNKTGLFAALCLALNYFHIDYSQELRFYTMVFLLSAVSYLFFIRAYKYTYARDFVLYSASTVALLYTHYFGLVIYGIQGLTFIVLAIFFKKDRRFIIGGLLSGIAVVVAFIPWLPIIVSDLGISNFWIKRPTPAFLLEYFYAYFGKDILTTLIGVALTVVFFKQIRNKENSGSQPLYVILVTWLVLSYLIPYVKSVIGTPILHVRYTIITLPVWMIIFAMGWTYIKNDKWKYSLAVVLVLASLINLFFLRDYYSRVRKQQIREASEMIKALNTSHLPVVSAFPWHLNFYFKGHPIQVDHVTAIDPAKMDQFWLLRIELTQEDKEQEIQPLLETFEIAEKRPFYKVDALLMKKKGFK